MLNNRKLQCFCALALLSGALMLLLRTEPRFAEDTAARNNAVPHQSAAPSQPQIAVLPRSGSETNLQLMNAREVLALAKKLAAKGQFAGADRALAPHLARNWRSTLSFTELLDALVDPAGTPQFRAFLTDFLIHASNLTPEESLRLNAALMAIAESSTEDTAFRKCVLMALRINTDDAQAQRIRAIARQQETPPEVRAAAITAMRRTGDVLGHDTLAREVLSQAQTSPAIMVQHAMVSLAKGSNAANHIKAFTEIAITAADSEVRASAIYSLGMAKAPEAVVSIIQSAPLHGNPHIVRYSLQRNEPVILSMLDINQPKVIIESAIEAARLGEIASAVPLLRSLAQSYSDLEVRNKSAQAIADLSSVLVKTNAIRKRNE